MAETEDPFYANYRKWLDACLEEFNERYGQDEPRRYHQESLPADEAYETWEFVEFSEGGDAYPHGIGGTAHIARAVTPWEESEFFIPLNLGSGPAP